MESEVLFLKCVIECVKSEVVFLRSEARLLTNVMVLLRSESVYWDGEGGKWEGTGQLLGRVRGFSGCESGILEGTGEEWEGLIFPERGTVGLLEDVIGELRR